MTLQQLSDDIPHAHGITRILDVTQVSTDKGPQQVRNPTRSRLMVLIRPGYTLMTPQTESACDQGALVYKHTVTCSNAPGAGFPVEAANLSAVPNLAVGSVRRVDTICANHHNHNKDMSATRHAGAHDYRRCRCLHILKVERCIQTRAGDTLLDPPGSSLPKQSTASCLGGGLPHLPADSVGYDKVWARGVLARPLLLLVQLRTTQTKAKRGRRTLGRNRLQNKPGRTSRQGPHKTKGTRARGEREGPS